MAKLDDLAYRLAAPLRGFPDAYYLAKRSYDRMTNGLFTQLRRVVDKTSPELLVNPPSESSKGRVLFFSPFWWSTHVVWETVMATALRAEGYSPEFVGCGGAARFCECYLPETKPGSVCPQCLRDLRAFVTTVGFPYSTYADFIDVEKARREAREATRGLSLEACAAFEVDGVPLGWLTEMSVVRALRKINLQGDAQAVDVFRLFLESAYIDLLVARELLNTPWTLIVTFNGKFFFQSILYHMARAKGIGVLTHERGFHRNTMFCAINNQVNDFNIVKHFERERHIPVSAEEDEALKKIEATRRTGKATIVNYFPTMDEDRKAILLEHGIDPKFPTTVAYPNIIWDTAVFRRDTAFTGLWPWLKTTIEFFVGHPEQQLVVRLHPAEVRLPQKTMERMGELIEKHFPNLPKNIRIIPSGSATSSYVLMDLADRVVVYSSTMGLEAAMSGKEVVTAAQMHYRKLGFTRDSDTVEEYLANLSATPRPLTPEETALARKYAALFFFRFAIPVRSFVEDQLGHVRLHFDRFDDLLSGDYPEVEFARRRIFPLRDGAVLLEKSVF